MGRDLGVLRGGGGPRIPVWGGFGGGLRVLGGGVHGVGGGPEWGGVWVRQTDGHPPSPPHSQFQPHIVLVAAPCDSALGDPEVWGPIGWAYRVGYRVGL